MGELQRVLAVFALWMATTLAAIAQCPDGTPPPCTQKTPVRKLDAARWAVFPFETRGTRADAALNRVGVHLMIGYELSRWRDLSVVEDAALCGRLPQRTANRGTLSIPQARAIAESFEAANLLVGELSPRGSEARVTARVIDTRTGRVVRAASVTAALTDSVLTHAIGGLTAALLDFAVDPGHSEQAKGTTSSAAYRAYLLGRAEERASQTAAATAHYRVAISLDTTYALAQYAAFLSTYDESRHVGDATLAHAALRNARGLPLPLRQKIAAAEALSRRATTDACAMYRELFKADSTDRDVQRGMRWSCDR